MTFIKNSIVICILAFTIIAIPSSAISKEIEVGDKAPDFTVQDISGNPISLSSLKGKVVLIDFWASWCGYCKITNEEFIPIYNKYHDQGFEIFSVSMDLKKDAWIKAIKEQQIPWKYHGSDLKGWEHSKIAELYNVEKLPATFLIDENGRILEMELDEADLEKKLNWYFNQQIRFYPIHARTKLFFTSKTKYQIENHDGTVIKKGKDLEVDITDFNPGEYLVKFDDKSEKFFKKTYNHPPVTFFPERVEDKITLSAEAEYEIYNSKGKLIKAGKGISINVNDLQSGTYHLSIDGDIHSFFKK